MFELVWEDPDRTATPADLSLVRPDGATQDGSSLGTADPHVTQVARKGGGFPKAVLDWTVRQFASQYCKGSINSELPGQFEEVTIADLIDLAKGGDAAARKCAKLLKEPRFRK